MDNSLWPSFEAVREKMVHQYEAQVFPADTGLDVKTLEQELRCYIDGHSDEPRIRLRAAAFAYLLENARIRVDTFDCFADHIAAGSFTKKIREEWRNEVNGSSHYDFWGLYNFCQDGAGLSCLDLSHTSPGWKRLLELGICGIRDEAAARLKNAKSDSSREFFSAVATVYEAIRKYILRLAAEARRVGVPRVAECLENIAKRPPHSFYEALQVSFIYNQMQELEGENVRTQGTFDQLYIDYYRRDIAEGRLTESQAKELVEFYFEKLAALHFGAGKNVCLGGRAPDGSDLCNELTEIALDVFEARQDVDPKLSLRVHAKMPERILLKAAACVRKGLSSIVFANHDVAETMFLKRGKTPGEIVDFVPVGCYEPAIMGKEVCCSMSAVINFAKIVERLFSIPEEPGCIEEVMARYKTLLGEVVDETLEKSRCWERAWKDINPSPVMSGVMEGCLEKGLDVSEAGARYNSSGVTCAGLGTAADSMAAINYLVFETKRCSWRELGEMLSADWQGHEELRLAARTRAPKWGNGIPSVDSFAIEIASFAADRINHFPNARGGFFQMGCWSIDLCLHFGKFTGATPDGRKMGEPFSKNAGAATGADANGITALINSVAGLDHSEFPDGSVLDLMLHPSAVNAPGGEAIVASLIKTYFSKGGLFVHFNVLDARILRQAQLEPEKYRNLQVRVCGWSARFVTLSKEIQKLFIAQAEALVA